MIKICSSVTPERSPSIVKVWLVTFSNGEEWHICGEQEEVWWSCVKYLMDFNTKNNTYIDFTMKYLRWV